MSHRKIGSFEEKNIKEVVENIYSKSCHEIRFQEQDPLRSYGATKLKKLGLCWLYLRTKAKVKFLRSEKYFNVWVYPIIDDIVFE